MTHSRIALQETCRTVTVAAGREIGHRTITIAHIGNLSMRLGRKLKWDPEKEEFIGDKEANVMLCRKQRQPWAIENIDSWLNVA